MDVINKNNMADIIKEVLEPNEIEPYSLNIHENLNSNLWDENDVLKPEIRKILLLNVKRFIEFSDIEGIKYQDIIFTGSMANYNYNTNSDIDVHIILDYGQISTNEEFVEDYFKLKKNLWSLNHHITVKNYDVEIYVQNSQSSFVKSTGIYSLVKNKWIIMPIKKIINIDTSSIGTKARVLMSDIDELNKIKNNDEFFNCYNQLKSKISKYRQCGLNKNGEYSIENLVFKILRNNGYLKKMVDEKNKRLDLELTLTQ
jgi:predicted nucleotidyltransferase